MPLYLKQTVAEFEINLLKQAMQQSQYNQRKAAQLLALSYHQFRGMLRKYQLQDGDNDTEQNQKESDRHRHQKSQHSAGVFI